MQSGSSDISLRLWGSPYANAALGKSVLLDHRLPTGEKVVLIICAKGIAAIACEASPMSPNSALLENAGDEPWPILQLLRQPDGRPKWIRWSPMEQHPTTLGLDTVREIHRAEPVLTDGGRRAIVEAIHGYYMQHVLEPSVTGFLSILEKQFSRAELYLFEVIQLVALYLQSKPQ